MKENGDSIKRSGKKSGKKSGKDSEEKIEKVIGLLREQFGVEKVDFELKEMGKDRIYAFRCEEFEGEPDHLDFIHHGFYFGKLEKDGLRLSIEGSFLVGRLATKNVVEINREDVEKWMMGENLNLNSMNLNFKSGREYREISDGYVILKCGSYFLGCGKLRDGVIRNFIPKNRQIKVGK
jgi:NOL1/NOP2/fmu family ribosome biogenesis protein